MLELILMPIFLAVQFFAWLVVSILGFTFNTLFRRDQLKQTDESGNDGKASLRPENPWQVFLFSLIGAAVLAAIGGGINFYFWGTTSAFWTGFGFVGVIGLMASISAATGEPPAM